MIAEQFNVAVDAYAVVDPVVRAAVDHLFRGLDESLSRVFHERHAG